MKFIQLDEEIINIKNLIRVFFLKHSVYQASTEIMWNPSNTLCFEISDDRSAERFKYLPTKNPVRIFIAIKIFLNRENDFFLDLDRMGDSENGSDTDCSLSG